MNHARVQFRCTACGRTAEVEVKMRTDKTIVMSPLPSFARTDSAASSLRPCPGEPETELPSGVCASLAVLSGPDKEVVYRLTKGRVVLGREGADIVLNDPEVSRFHCLLEVRDKFVSLKDMDSTNGTFFEEERARAAMLVDGAEFRVGSTRLRLNLSTR